MFSVHISPIPLGWQRRQVDTTAGTLNEYVELEQIVNSIYFLLAALELVVMVSLSLLSPQCLLGRAHVHTMTIQCCQWIGCGWMWMDILFIHLFEVE